MSPSGDVMYMSGVCRYDVHSCEGNVIGEVDEPLALAAGVAEYFVAYAYKRPDDADGKYRLGTYEELAEAEAAVCAEYDRLGPFEEE